MFLLCFSLRIAGYCWKRSLDSVGVNSTGEKEKKRKIISPCIFIILKIFNPCFLVQIAERVSAMLSGCQFTHTS
jgi:hypothetical protein